MVEFRDGLGFSLAELAAAMTQCFAGYVVPMTVSPTALASLLRVDSVDLAETIVATDDGHVVGIVLTCRRGDVSRIGAMAVSHDRRRTGLGTSLMMHALDAAKARGDRKVVLEAIESNVRAIAFYARFGFTARFRLVAFSCPILGETTAISLFQSDVEELALATSVHGESASSWKTAAASIYQLASPVRVYAAGNLIAAISAQGDDRLILHGMSMPAQDVPRDLQALLAGLGSLFPNRTLHVPPFFPEPEFGSALRACGFAEGAVHQVQMELVLDKPNPH